MGHCPWLDIYLGYVPFAARLMKQLLDYGEERATERIKNGSLARDLFYYLVRSVSRLYASRSESDLDRGTVEQRRWNGKSGSPTCYCRD